MTTLTLTNTVSTLGGRDGIVSVELSADELGKADNIARIEFTDGSVIVASLDRDAYGKYTHIEWSHYVPSLFGGMELTDTRHARGDASFMEYVDDVLDDMDR